MDEQPRTPKKPLREAMRSARIEAAERSAVIVDLRDAEAARLEMLNEALDPVFEELPPEHLDLFDRGLGAGTQPRLWVDMVAHVAMGRDKRTYRFLLDTANGRRILAESLDMEPIVAAVTSYVARRLVAREQMLAGMESDRPVAPPKAKAATPAREAEGSGDPWFMLLVGIGVGVILSLIVLAFR